MGGPFPPNENFLQHTEPGIVVQKAYDWSLWIIPKVEKFPKSLRFSIGQNLVTSSIELLMNLVDATYQSRNSGSLGAAVREVNRTRYLLRLAKDLRTLNLDLDALEIAVGSRASGRRRARPNLACQSPSNA